MKNIFAGLLSLILATCGAIPVSATTSTINPSVPAQGAALTSAPLRANFLAAYNDINNIYSTIAGISGGTPGGTTGQVQYNNGAGGFGGFSFNGDGTLNYGTGAFTVAQANGAAHFLPTTSGVDYFTLQGSATGSPAFINFGAGGTDSKIGMNYNSVGTTTTGSQFNGLCNGGACTSGDQFFNINGAHALQITDTLWNPNISYQGAPTAWPVLSSGALAGGPDNIAVISVNSSIYPATATGATLMYLAKGPTGEHHFSSNGVIGHVNIAAISNPLGNDVFNTAESSLWLYGAAAGNGGGAVIATQGSTSNGTLFYDENQGGYKFNSDNVTTGLFKLTRGALGGDGLNVTAQTAGSGPLVAAMGGGTNLPVTVSSKGNSAATIATENGAVTGLQVIDQGSGVNAVTVQPALTGQSAIISVGGPSSDASAGLLIKTKGTTQKNINLYDAGALQLQVGGGSSATSFTAINGAANSVSMSAQGGTNPTMTFYTVGSGGISFLADNIATGLLDLQRSASGGDGATLTAQTAGTGPLLQAKGSGSNINFNIQGKGTGALATSGEISNGTKFTASGCSVTTLVGGASAGTVTSGTTGTCTVVITMGGGIAAPNGWTCFANDETTSADTIKMSAHSTTTATLTGTTVSGDVISFRCGGY